MEIPFKQLILSTVAKRPSVPRGRIAVYFDTVLGKVATLKHGGEPEELGSGGGEVTVDNSSINEAIAEDPAATREAAKTIGYNQTSTVVVDASGTDTQRGTALQAAYVAAKALTPGGSALSNTNRAAVILPAGAYKLSSTLTLDTNYVDLVALTPTQGGTRLATDSDEQGGETSLTNYRPPVTVVYSDENSSPFTVMKQTCDNVRLIGFGIAYLGTAGGFDVGSFRCLHIDRDQSDANSGSVYDTMYFFHRTTSDDLLGSNQDQGREPVWATKHLQGTWRNCTANAYAWRMGQNGTFTARMYDCVAGAMSWGGDAVGATFGACYLERCVGVGLLVGGVGQGDGCFGGCAGTGIPISADAVFIECEATGAFSFAVGRDCAGVFIRCRGGQKSFGGTHIAVTPGTFSGYAEDCVSGAGSFGGTGVSGYGKCTGTLLRCKVEGNTQSMRLEGAKIRDSRITTTTTGIHALTILDSNSTISNTDIIVYQGGTGVPIYAASALNVAAYHCRMNNASNDADGLHSNVTNLVTTPYNVISNSVK